MQSFVTVLLFRQSAQNIASIVNFLPLLSAFIHFKLADQYVFNQHFFIWMVSFESPVNYFYYNSSLSNSFSEELSIFLSFSMPKTMLFSALLLRYWSWLCVVSITWSVHTLCYDSHSLCLRMQGPLLLEGAWTWFFLQVNWF